MTSFLGTRLSRIESRDILPAVAGKVSARLSRCVPRWCHLAGASSFPLDVDALG
jgi:hypothetical protein